MTLRKKYIAGIMFALTSAFGIVSCSNEDFSEHIGSSVLHPRVSVNSSTVGVDGSVSYNLAYPVPSVSEMNLKITNLQSGKQAYWESVDDYPEDNSYLPGRYLVETAFGDSITEGMECPYFYASATVDLSDGADLVLPLEARLRSTMLKVEFSESFLTMFSTFSAILHSQGGAYVNYPGSEHRYAYLHPGNISVQLNLEMPGSGKELRFEAAQLPEAKPGYAYIASVSAEMLPNGNPQITVSFDGTVSTDDSVTELSEQFINTTPPEVTCAGFTSSTPLEWIEGTTGTTPLTMSVSENQLESAILTTRSLTLCNQGWPTGIDLMQATPDCVAAMEALGLKISRQNGTLTLDYTEVLPRLRYDAEAQSTLFILEPKNKLQIVGTPAILEVVPLPVDLRVASVTDVVAGVNVGEILVESPTDQLSDNLELQAFASNKWVAMEIIGIESRGNGKYTVRYKAPDGTESLRARVVYCGITKAEFSINRVSPKFSIEVDAFALKAVVRVNAEDKALLPVITSMLTVYGNGAPLQQIDDDYANGIIVLGGLTASTNYSFTATVFANPSSADFCPAVNIRTEDITGLENGGFEDREKGFEYKDMPSGGRYSQSIVPIFNQQNRASYEVYVPEKWANTNSKTACMDARNINTWYVQPSVQIVEDAYAGTYAVLLQSVGWDVNGEPIPDYLQPNANYTQYSCNAPNIGHTATGRLFLGDYRFYSGFVTEHYDLGIGFGSRPTALNGFYKFVPSPSAPSDRGAVLVEVLGIDNGVEIVLGRTELQLRPAMTYTAFSAQISYPHFGVKATALRVMMASSIHYGSIAEETANVPVSKNLETSTAIGSRLWIDELSLSY